MTRPISATGFLTTAGSLAKDDRTPVKLLRSASGSQGLDTRLLQVATTFQQLQDARHQADYHSNYDPYRATTLTHVQDAEAALKATLWFWRSGASVHTSRQRAHATYSCFLRLALMKSGGPKAR